MVKDISAPEPHRISPKHFSFKLSKKMSDIPIIDNITETIMDSLLPKISVKIIPKKSPAEAPKRMAYCIRVILCIVSQWLSPL